MQNRYTCEQIEPSFVHNHERGRLVVPANLVPPRPVPIRSVGTRTNVVKSVSLAARELAIVRVRREDRKTMAEHPTDSSSTMSHQFLAHLGGVGNPQCLHLISGSSGCSGISYGADHADL